MRLSPRRCWAIARKESIQIVRDPRSLYLGIAMPVVLLLLFGFALTLDVDRVPTVVWDQSQTQASRDLVSRFAGSRYFSIADYARDYRQVERDIDTGRALVAVVVPVDFAGNLESGKPAPLQVIVDGSDSNTATIAIAYAESVVQTYSLDLQLRVTQRLIGGPSAQALLPPVDPRPRVWFNADLESRNYIIPGLLAVIMMVIAALLTSLTVAREWERGTMEQLISTPVKGPELILGKLAPYFVIGLFDVLLAVLMGQFLFHVPLRGSVPLLFAMAAVFLVGALSMGLLISIVMKNQLLASQFALVTTFLPAFLLSGFMFAIENMPPVIQAFTYIVPSRYFIVLLKGIYLKGVGLRVMWPQAAMLAAFAVVALTLANVKFRKKLE